MTVYFFNSGRVGMAVSELVKTNVCVRLQCAGVGLSDSKQ